MRTSALVEFLEPAVPAVHNDNTVIDRAEAAIKKLFGPEAIYPMRFPTAGSEDFALYLDSCPGAIIPEKALRRRAFRSTIILILHRNSPHDSFVPFRPLRFLKSFPSLC